MHMPYVRTYICVCQLQIYLILCTYMQLCINIHTQDKEHSIRRDDLGRDIATVQALQRKHETFEHELEALGNQVLLFK